MVLQFHHFLLPLGGAGGKCHRFQLCNVQLSSLSRSLSHTHTHARTHTTYTLPSRDFHEWVNKKRHNSRANLCRLQPGGVEEKKKENVCIMQSQPYSLQTSVPVFPLELIKHLAN